jgi:hypothetical protein
MRVFLSGKFDILPPPSTRHLPPAVVASEGGGGGTTTTTTTTTGRRAQSAPGWRGQYPTSRISDRIWRGSRPRDAPVAVGGRCDREEDEVGIRGRRRGSMPCPG